MILLGDISDSIHYTTNERISVSWPLLMDLEAAEAQFKELYNEP